MVEKVEEKVVKYKVVCDKCGKEIFGRSEKEAEFLLRQHKKLKGCL